MKVDIINMEEVKRKLEIFLEIVKSMEEFPRIDFIIFYGSLAQGKGNKSSDIDICVSFRGKKEDMSRFRLKLLTELCDDSYDIQIFQQLPLYVQIEVLKGKVLYVRDKKFLSDIALKTIREFDFFKPHYYDYIYG